MRKKDGEGGDVGQVLDVPAWVGIKPSRRKGDGFSGNSGGVLGEKSDRQAHRKNVGLRVLGFSGLGPSDLGCVGVCKGGRVCVIVC